MSIQEIHKEAVAAAEAAETAFVKNFGEPFYCGFAWVTARVSRTNSAEAKELMSVGFQKDWEPKKLCLWNPSGNPTQSMDIKEVGARAYADVLRKYGYNVRVGTRAD